MLGRFWCFLMGHRFFYMHANGAGLGVLACARCKTVEVTK